MKLADARKAVLAGKAQEALPSLVELADAGAASAWAILAQIRAYKGEWDGVLDAVARLLANPNDIHASNVTHDAKWLLLRAGHETQRWPDVAAAIESQAALSRDSRDPIGKMIAKQAKAKGKLPEPPYAAIETDKRKQATRERDFEEAIAECETRWRKKRPKAGEREQLQWSYATTYELDDKALAAWPTTEPFELWDAAVEAARLFARHNRPKEAAAILERKIANFWPIDGGQGLPVEPIVDEILRPLMTPKILSHLLSTPKMQEP